MSKLAILANIFAVPDQIGLVKKELQKLIEVTRAEQGCLQYDLHQDNENPAHFVFYEKWVSPQHWQTHMDAQHLKDYMSATAGAIDDFQLNELNPI